MRGTVWGLHFGDAADMLHEIEYNYKYYGIEVENRRETKNDYSIKFKNGDYWRAARASESMRGLRANISYVDIRIDPRFVEEIIRPATYLPPYNAIRYFEAPRHCWPKEEEEDNELSDYFTTIT